MSEEKKKVSCKPVVKRKSSVSALVSRNISTKIIADDPKFIPQYKTNGAACADLIANIPAPINLANRNSALIDCGFSLAIPEGYKGVIVGRSGLAKKGLHVHMGTIDSDYRGRLKVSVLNIGREILVISPGDRIAQFYLTPVYRFDWEPVTQLEETERGEGGFGSTGSN